MALENAGYQEALSLYCNLEALWMGIYDEVARGPESRRVWETRLGSHPSWRALSKTRAPHTTAQRMGKHY